VPTSAGLNFLLSLNILDGHPRTTSASSGRLDSLWQVYRYETLGLLLEEQGHRARGETAAALCERAYLKVATILPTWSVSGLSSPGGLALTLISSPIERR